MSRFVAGVDQTRFVIIEPKIVRAFWSKRRAWHGDEVRLHVETKYVPDGTAIKLEVWEDDSGEGSPDDFIAELEGTFEVTNNRCIADYTIDWSEDALGAELALEGGELEFYFRASIDTFEITARSSLLYVDLSDYLYSS